VYFWTEEIPPTPDEAGLRWGFTSRQGGASAPPFDGLNLGGNTEDAPESVEANRTEVATSLELPRDRLIFMNQCHGSEVVVVDGPWGADTPSADGVVTARDDVALAVLVADCVPVLLADRAAGVVGAVHAGRPGMTSRVIDRAVEAMRRAGSTRIEAAVGPSVCGRCYEVPASMRAEAAAVSPVSATVSWTGTPAIDVAAGVVDQLREQDVTVTWVPGCSREDERLFSYRQAPQTGRFAGVVRLSPRGSTR